jgi:hypothetical protein
VHFSTEISLFSCPWIRIRIPNTDPDPQNLWIRIQSGSTTLLNTVELMECYCEGCDEPAAAGWGADRSVGGSRAGHHWCLTAHSNWDTLTTSPSSSNTKVRRYISLGNNFRNRYRYCTLSCSLDCVVNCIFTGFFLIDTGTETTLLLCLLYLVDFMNGRIRAWIL